MEKWLIIKNWLFLNNRSTYFIKYKITGVITLVILFCACHVFSQINLVPNESFENYSVCPSLGAGEINKATPWFQPNNPSVSPGGSSDFFHSCSGNVPFLITYQYPKTGNGYAGISFFTDPSVNNLDYWREYIEVGLTDSLETGKKYCVRFYANKGNWSSYAVKNIQAVLTNNSLIYNDPNYGYINGVNPIMEADSVITDTLNWIPIQTTYTAHGGEKFLTIGNFSSGANTVYKYVWPFGGTPNTLGYYLIDDVSIILCDTTLTNTKNSEIKTPNIFTPNNDGINDTFKIITKNITTLNCKIYDRWGVLVNELTKFNEAWDGRTTSGVQCSAGVYYYTITAIGEEGREYNEKGVLELIK